MTRNVQSCGEKGYARRTKGDAKRSKTLQTPKTQPLVQISKSPKPFETTQDGPQSPKVPNLELL